MENKILTWKNLRKRGQVGPGFFPLCRKEEELVEHLFLECDYNKVVWSYTPRDLKVNLDWRGSCLEDIFKDWYAKEKVFKMLPIFIFQNILKIRNKIIFKNVTPSVSYCRVKSISLLKEFEEIIITHKHKFIYRNGLHPFSALDFFYRSSMNGLCGRGMVVKINESHWFNLWMGGRQGSNTKFELLGLWGVLFFSKKCGIDSLVIYGDSKIIIEWEKGNFNLQVNLLQSLCKRMISLITYFNQLYFMHIRRSYNKKVDRLSKTMVKEVFGNLFFHAFQEGNIFLEGSELID